MRFYLQYSEVKQQLLLLLRVATFSPADALFSSFIFCSLSVERFGVVALKTYLFLACLLRCFWSVFGPVFFFFFLFGYTLTTRLLRNTSVALQLRLQSSSSSRQSSRLCVQCQLARRAVFHYPMFLSPPHQTQTRPQLGMYVAGWPLIFRWFSFLC
jgi:hypothetical protein